MAETKEQGHSPLPWRVVTEDGSMGGIKAADGDPVAQTQQRLNDPRHAERKANAKLIVTAVNAHSDLLTAAKAALERELDLAAQLEQWARESMDGGWSTHQVDPMRKRADKIRRDIQPLRAAISKAQGE